MPKPEPVLKNETHEILCDFERQIDHRIPARRPDVELINKKKYLDLAKELKKSETWKVATIPIVIETI